MNTDAYFTIGDSHLVCEDYALSSDNKIVVCDGCSSSEMTDVGARLLALTAMSSMGRNFTQLILNDIKGKIIDLVYNFMDCPDTMFDSTLLMAKIINDYVKIMVIGDGVIVGKKKGGNVIRLIDFESPNNYPYYLTYELDSDRKKLYLKQESVLVIKENYIICDESFNSYAESVHYINILDNYCYSELFLKHDYDWIALMSDGVHSFRDENKKDIPIEKIIAELTNFKTFTGEFVKRRLNKFKKDCVKKGWTHYDDLSMAVIYLGD